MIAVIDPGYAKSGNGSAIVWCSDAGVIEAASFMRPDSCYLPDAPSLSLVVIEKPQFDGRTIAACRTTLELAWQGALLAGRLAARGTKIVEVNPRDWKQSTPKPITHAKLWAVLSPGERELLEGEATEAKIRRAIDHGALNRWAPGRAYYPTTWILHNILDAACIACVYFGRLKLI